MAVYTKLDGENFSSILAQYNIGDLVNFTAISAGVENTNYFLETSQGKFVLTIFEQRVKQQDLPFYLNLMNYLQKNQFPCPKIYKTKNDDLVFRHKSKIGIIISFLSGSNVNNINSNNIAKLGETLAKMHLLTVDFTDRKKNDFDFAGINNFYHKLKSNKIIKTEAVEILEPLLDRLSNLDYSVLQKGVIHADLFPDNILFSNDEITGVIDFYFSCYDYLIFDIAISINAWCFDQEINFQEELALLLFKNYNNIRKISPAEMSILQDFCILAAMRFYFTRLHDQFFHDSKNLVQVKAPEEFLKRIKFFTEFNDFRLC